jgi:hypothetical protein
MSRDLDADLCRRRLGLRSFRRPGWCRERGEEGIRVGQADAQRAQSCRDAEAAPPLRRVEVDPDEVAPARVDQPGATPAVGADADTAVRVAACGEDARARDP